MLKTGLKLAQNLLLSKFLHRLEAANVNIISGNMTNYIKGTPHWLEISNIGQILEILLGPILDIFINKCPINVQYLSNIGHISSQCGGLYSSISKVAERVKCDFLFF